LGVCLVGVVVVGGIDVLVGGCGEVVGE